MAMSMKVFQISRISSSTTLNPSWDLALATLSPMKTVQAQLLILMIQVNFPFVLLINLGTESALILPLCVIVILPCCSVPLTILTAPGSIVDFDEMDDDELDGLYLRRNGSITIFLVPQPGCLRRLQWWHTDAFFIAIAFGLPMTDLCLGPRLLCSSFWRLLLLKSPLVMMVDVKPGEYFLALKAARIIDI